MHADVREIGVRGPGEWIATKSARGTPSVAEAMEGRKGCARCARAGGWIVRGTLTPSLSRGEREERHLTPVPAPETPSRCRASPFPGDREGKLRCAQFSHSLSTRGGEGRVRGGFGSRGRTVADPVHVLLHANLPGCGRGPLL